MAKKMAIKTKVKEKKKRASLVMPKFILSIVKALAVISLFIGGWFFISLVPNVWPIEKIAIIGEVEHVDQSQLVEILSAENAMGMLTIDLQNIRQKTLQMPWVKSVQIRKDWPDTLSFMFEEYQPIALINDSYLTEKGTLIKKDAYVYNQPVLKLVIDKMQIKEQGDLALLVKSIAEVRDSLASHQLIFEKMEISESNSWLITIDNKFVIKAGRKQQLQRIEKFLQVYAAIENKNKLESVDLRYSNGLAVKLLEESSKPMKNG